MCEQVSSFFPGASERCARFRDLFEFQNQLGDAINSVLDSNLIGQRDGEERFLSWVVAANLGKALKTFQAALRLCLLGFGHDALILVRSNINVLINTWFILSPEKHRLDRAKDFLAYSYAEHVKYLRIMGETEIPPGPMPPEELRQRKEHWKRTSIEQRAAGLPDFHYQHGYRFYSSLEHSDVLGLGQYFEGPLRIESGPSDAHVELALVHNFQALADLLRLVCQYFHIDRPDLFDQLDNISRQLATRSA